MTRRPALVYFYVCFTCASRNLRAPWPRKSAKVCVNQAQIWPFTPRSHRGPGTLRVLVGSAIRGEDRAELLHARETEDPFVLSSVGLALPVENATAQGVFSEGLVRLSRRPRRSLDRFHHRPEQP